MQIIITHLDNFKVKRFFRSDLELWKSSLQHSTVQCTVQSNAQYSPVHRTFSHA